MQSVLFWQTLFSHQKSMFSQKNMKQGRSVPILPRFFFVIFYAILCRHSVNETDKCFRFYVSFIPSSRSDGFGIPRNILQQFLCVRIFGAEELPADMYRHSHIHFIFVNICVIFPNDNLIYNAAAEVWHNHCRKEFLFYKSIIFINKTQNTSFTDKQT